MSRSEDPGRLCFPRALLSVDAFPRKKNLSCISVENENFLKLVFLLCIKITIWVLHKDLKGITYNPNLTQCFFSFLQVSCEYLFIFIHKFTWLDYSIHIISFYSRNVMFFFYLSCSCYHILGDCLCSVSEWSTIYLTNSLLQDACLVSSLSLFKETRVVFASGILLSQARPCWIRYCNFGFVPSVKQLYRVTAPSEGWRARPQLSNAEYN